MKDGITHIALGIIVLLIGGAISLAWLAFCIGTVFIGVILLLTAPGALISPLMTSVRRGVAEIAQGRALLAQRRNRLGQTQ